MSGHQNSETFEQSLRTSEAGIDSRPLLLNIFSDLEEQRERVTEVYESFLEQEAEALSAIRKEHQELLNTHDDDTKLSIAQNIAPAVRTLIDKLTVMIEPEFTQGYLWINAHELAGTEVQRALPFITITWEQTTHGPVSTGSDVGVKHWDNPPEGLSETVKKMIENDEHLNNLWHLDKLLALKPFWNADRGGSFDLPSDMSRHLERSFGQAVSDITAQIFYAGKRDSFGWEALKYNSPVALMYKAQSSMLRNRLHIVANELVKHFDMLSLSSVIGPHHSAFIKSEKQVRSE